MKQAWTAIVCGLALTGCASIFNGQTQSVVIATKPEGAQVKVTNRDGESIHSGVTPVTLSLKRGYGYFKSETYTIRFEKPGFEAKEVVISGSPSGWYFGNLLLGGLIGMLAVDPVTGAMYVFPDRIEQELNTTTAQTGDAERTLQVVSLDTLSPAQRAQGRLLDVAR